MIEERLINSCEHCQVGWKNFQFLSKSELMLVNENRYEATFKPGETILKQGSPASSTVFLAKGMAKIYTESKDHKRYILEIAQPSRMIVGPGVLDHASNLYSVAALTPVQTCFISLKIINQLIRQNAHFAFGMIQDLSSKSLTVHNRLISLTQKKMPGRLAEAILLLSDTVYKSDAFDLILTRRELGEMTDMTEESLIRILKDLNTSGIVKSSRSAIEILDREKLKAIADL